MESQELFNTMMESAIVYLQEKGYISKPTQQEPNNIDWNNPEHTKRVTETLQARGLLPRDK